MLIQLIAQHPQAIGTILKNTPTWVWGLLSALLVLGLSQVRSRDVGQVRMALTPVAMTGLSLWGTLSAFGQTLLLAPVMLVWLAGAAVMFALIATRQPAAGARYNATNRSFHVPGSVVPLLLIMGIFFTKYIVGVELAMQPTLAHDTQYALVVSALYGLFSGTFAGRAARTWRLALRPGLPCEPALSA